jgi:hypothetical protein
MARKNSRYKPLHPWETATKDGYEQHYIRLGTTFLKHPAVQSLTFGTRWVLMCMMDSCAGFQHFTFTRKRYEEKYNLNYQTVIRAIKELESRRFIIKSRKEKHSLMEPNTYKWIWEWKGTQSK